MFLLTQNLESAAKSSIAQLPHLLTDCGQMWAWKKILAYASRRGENSELTVHIDAWYYLPEAQSREGIYQHREEFPRRSVNCVFLVWWEIWVCACNVDQSSAWTAAHGKKLHLWQLKTRTWKNPNSNQRSLKLFFVRTPAEQFDGLYFHQLITLIVAFLPFSRRPVPQWENIQTRTRHNVSRMLLGWKYAEQTMKGGCL